MQTIGGLNSWLQRDSDDGIVGTKLDGGVRAAMESSAIRACDRLDRILDDNARWGLPAVDAQSLGATHIAMINQLLAQKVMIGEVNQAMAFGDIESVVDRRPPRKARKKTVPKKAKQ